MKNIKLLFACTGLAFVGTEHAHAQAAPNVSTTEISTAGLATGSGLQNMAGNTYMRNDGSTLLVVRGGGTLVTATLISQAASMQKEGYGTIALSNQNVSIPANNVVLIGPFPPARWNNQSGLVQVSMSSVVGVSVTSAKVPR